MYKYKLKEEYLKQGDRTFIGHGVTNNGLIESETEIDSSLLELVHDRPVAVTPELPMPEVPQPLNQEQV